MAYEQMLYEVADAIATITLNRPEKLNAWTMRLGAEVRHAMLSADRDPAVRAIVVTGTGKGYCAGAEAGQRPVKRAARRSTNDATPSRKSSVPKQAIISRSASRIAEPRSLVCV